MDSFKVKKIIAYTLDITQLNKVMFWYLNHKRKSNYIRIVNYHATPMKDARNFEKQLRWYQKKYVNVNEEELDKFFNGEKEFWKKPGIMLTFDDGYESNAQMTNKLLNKWGFTGYFMVSSKLIGTKEYMTWGDLKRLISEGHVIGCHTATHHRMNTEDTYETLKEEIIDSKNTLEQKLKREISFFCWCGGEEQYYTKNAADVIREAKYKYSLMTNAYPVDMHCNHFQLERINVETSWNMALVRFQVSGWMDWKLKRKRMRIEKLTA